MPDGAGTAEVSTSEIKYRASIFRKILFKIQVLRKSNNPDTLKPIMSEISVPSNPSTRGKRFSVSDAFLVVAGGAIGFGAAGVEPTYCIIYGGAVASSIKVLDFILPELKR